MPIVRCRIHLLNISSPKHPVRVKSGQQAYAQEVQQTVRQVGVNNLQAYKKLSKKLKTARDLKPNNKIWKGLQCILGMVQEFRQGKEIHKCNKFKKHEKVKCKFLEEENMNTSCF